MPSNPTKKEKAQERDGEEHNIVNPQNSKKRKPPSQRKRDFDRMKKFIEDKQKGTPFVRGEVLRTATRAYIRHTSGEVERLTPHPPEPLPIQEKEVATQVTGSPVSFRRSGRDRRSSHGSGRRTGWYSAVPPIIRMTSQSLKYATQRLRDRGLFHLVRDYLAYFQHTKQGEVVGGESKFSSEMKIRSEGMPLGAELRIIYYNFAAGMGATEKVVTDDLEKVKAHLQSSRTIWLTSIRESERRYMTPWPTSGYYK